MNKKRKKRSLLALAGAGTLILSFTVQAESIKYCEEIGQKLGQYNSKDELFTDLTVKAQRKALGQILQAELAGFESKVLEREIFIDSLLHLVEYQQVEQASDGVLTPCIVLTEAKVEDIHRQRFKPVEVGKLCSFDTELLKKQTEEMKEKFVEHFFDKKGNGRKPASIAELLADPEKISKKFGKDLLKLLREQPLPPIPGTVEETQCTSVQIYPIELYALSVPYRKLQGDEEKEKDPAVPENNSSSLKDMADKQARWHGLDPRLFRALIEEESGWKIEAVSYRGAVGLAQLMPETARRECGLKADELSNPRDNLACAAHYLAKQLKRYGGDTRLALCAYNAGPGTVNDGKCRQYSETRRYVRNIMSYFGA